MNSRKGQAIIGGCIVVTLIGFLSFAILGGLGSDQGIRDVGVFKVGFEKGLVRSGFSGRPMVQVFIPDSDLTLFNSIATVLSSEEITKAMQNFIGIIIPLPKEPVLTEEEKEKRVKEQQQAIENALATEIPLPQEIILPRFPDNDLPVVVIQNANGQIIGSVNKERFNQQNLLELLNISAPMIQIMKSPLYETIKENPEYLNKLVRDGEIKAVEDAIEVLKEIEPESPCIGHALTALDSVKR